MSSDFVYFIDVPEEPSTSVLIGFVPYLPHGNPVYVYDVA